MPTAEEELEAALQKKEKAELVGILLAIFGPWYLPDGSLRFNLDVDPVLLRDTISREHDAIANPTRCLLPSIPTKETQLARDDEEAIEANIEARRERKERDSDPSRW